MSGRKVLLVEDVEDNRGIIRQLGTRMQLQLFEANDGIEGIEMARTHLPDLILMDLSLPRLDGWQATSRLKADPATAHIPVIALTAHAMAGDEARARQAGCSGYLSKPIDIAAFRALVERALAGEAL